MLADLLEDLRRQSRRADKIVVIDNASQDYTERLVRDNYPEVQYLRCKENTGSAGGYHEGIGQACPGSDFIYTLDDDVRLYPEALAAALAGFHSLEEKMTFPIGAVRSVGQRHLETVPTKLDIFSWRGTLLKSKLIQEIGLPRRDYFFYGEDLEYSLRFREKGYAFFWIPGSICQERDRPGRIHARKWGICIIRYEDHFRLYYAFRNEIYTYLYYRLFLKVIRTLLYGLKVSMLIVSSEGGRGKPAILAIVRGIGDGLRGRLGFNANYIPWGKRETRDENLK